MSLKAKLTRIDEGATNETGIRQEVVIDDVTQLGRLASLTRETPGSSWWMRRYAKPRLAVQINDPTESLSANHAIIQPSQVEGGSFSIQDYGSTNGTFVNGNPVPRIPTGISSLWNKNE